MKKNISLLLITVIVLGGCSSNSDSGVTPDDNVGTVSCTINSKSWTSTKTLDASNKLQKAFMAQNFTDKTAIGFNLDMANVKTGTTVIYDRTNVYQGIEYRTIDADGQLVANFGGTGKITITNATTTLVEGTFAFEAKNVSVTNGKFSLKTTPW